MIPAAEHSFKGKYGRNVNSYADQIRLQKISNHRTIWIAM